jgi:lipopolysaccharide/colanic/teichoic acid biosynthesis glycosyltransferase
MGMNVLQEEPVEAFVCKPPTEEMKARYRKIFALTEPLPNRTLKLAFDKLLALTALILASPIFLILVLAYSIEGLFVPDARGWFFVSYIAGSRGKKFNKWKFRLLKNRYVDQELARKGDWHAYAGEWKPEARTRVGDFVKKYYLDELPQLYSILRGDMSFVGPRPLAWHHYERNLAQGNVYGKVLTGGLLGQGQAMKGTSKRGDAGVEYEYIENYMELSALQLLWLDMKILVRGLRVMAKGQGL